MVSVTDSWNWLEQNLIFLHPPQNRIIWGISVDLFIKLFLRSYLWSQ